MDVLKVKLQKVENEVLKVALKEELRHSYEASTEDVAYVQEEFNKFCQNQEMKNAILNSADLLKESDFDGIRNTIEKAMKAGMDKNIGHEYNKDVETRYRDNYRPTIPSPWPVFNDGIQGGFGPGDLGIVFGSPGGGKSCPIFLSIPAFIAFSIVFLNTIKITFFNKSAELRIAFFIS